MIRGHDVPDTEKEVIKDAKTKNGDTVDHRVDGMIGAQGKYWEEGPLRMKETWAGTRVEELC